MRSSDLMVLLLVIMVSACASSVQISRRQSKLRIPVEQLQNGDFIFQDLSCGPLCDAIEAVTPGLEGRHFSHVGLVQRIKDSVFVVEAISQGGVVRTPLSNFLSRTNLMEENVFMRLSPKHVSLIPDVFKFIDSSLGVEYDEVYVMGNGKYYCSELIYEAFKYANENKEFFKLYPMTFKNPSSDDFNEAWVTYYANLQLEIPEDELGCNPGGLATSGFLERL